MATMNEPVTATCVRALNEMGVEVEAIYAGYRVKFADGSVELYSKLEFELLCLRTHHLFDQGELEEAAETGRAS